MAAPISAWQSHRKPMTTVKSRLACYGMDSCGDALASATNPATVSSPATAIFITRFSTSPIFIKCDPVSDQLSALKIQLRGPWFRSFGHDAIHPASSPATTPRHVCRHGVLHFHTGEKSTIARGSNDALVHRCPRQRRGLPTYPIDYGIRLLGNRAPPPCPGPAQSTGSDHTGKRGASQ